MEWTQASNPTDDVWTAQAGGRDYQIVRTGSVKVGGNEYSLFHLTVEAGGKQVKSEAALSLDSAKAMAEASV